MDGLDCGIFDLNLSDDLNLNWSCTFFHTFPFSQEIRQLISKAILGDEKSILDADMELGKLFSSIVLDLLDKEIDLIASHGQTISHVDGHSTRQIGNLLSLKKKYDIPLIFDEVVNGFRISEGGAQQKFGIKPDITTLGKALGNGFTISAVGGKSEIMNLLSPQGKVYQASTFAGNPISVAAGISSIKTINKILSCN